MPDNRRREWAAFPSDARLIPVIIVTGHYLDHSTRALIRREPNVREFMEKPVRISALSTALHNTLRTRGRPKGVCPPRWG